MFRLNTSSQSGSMQENEQLRTLSSNHIIRICCRLAVESTTALLEIAVETVIQQVSSKSVLCALSCASRSIHRQVFRGSSSVTWSMSLGGKPRSVRPSGSCSLPSDIHLHDAWQPFMQSLSPASQIIYSTHAPRHLTLTRHMMAFRFTSHLRDETRQTRARSER